MHGKMHGMDACMINMHNMDFVYQHIRCKWHYSLNNNFIVSLLYQPCLQKLAVVKTEIIQDNLIGRMT